MFAVVSFLDSSWMKDDIAEENVTSPQLLEMIILPRLGV